MGEELSQDIVVKKSLLAGANFSSHLSMMGKNGK